MSTEIDNQNNDINENNPRDAEYSPKSEFSKARQVDDAVRKIIETRSNEMKEGYFNETLSKDGENVIRSYIPDTRKVFISSIEALRYLLSPEIELDKTTKQFISDFIKKKKEIFEKYCYKERRYIQKEDDSFVWVYKKDGRKYIPENDETLAELPYFEKNRSGTGGDWEHPQLKGLWNSKVHAYYWELVELYDTLFGELNDLIHRKNYFKSKGGFGN